MDMCSGPILKKMLIFSIPLMCSSILQLLFNAADIVVVGRFAGDNSLAAVGSTASLIGLLTNLFIGLSIGANVLVARYYGANNEKELSETVHTAMLLSMISGGILTVVGLFGAKYILILMNTPDEVLGLATTYLRIYFLGMTATMVYNFGSAILRAVGDTKRPLYFLAVAGVINVVLNLFFVIQLKMDVAGVATATAISQCVSAALILYCLRMEDGGIRLDLRRLRIFKDKLKQIMEIGLPAGFQGILFSISNVAIQASVNSFGNIIMAGNSAAANIENFVYFSMNTFYQAAISFTSQNVGAGKYDRIHKITIRSQICAVVTGLVLGNLAYLFGHTLLGIYTTSELVIEAGMRRLSIISCTYALCGIMDTMVGSLRGLGYSIMPMIVSLVGVCALRLVWIGTIFQMEQYHTVEGVFWSYPVTWVITATAHIICYIWAMKKLKRKVEAEHETDRLCSQ